jgi:hypothetical protein
MLRFRVQVKAYDNSRLFERSLFAENRYIINRAVEDFGLAGLHNTYWGINFLLFNYTRKRMVANIVFNTKLFLRLNNSHRNAV